MAQQTTKDVSARRWLTLIPIGMLCWSTVGTAADNPPAGDQASVDQATTSLPLFDGQSLDNWMTLDGEPVTHGWEVVDGMIHLVKGKKRSGHIITRDKYGDFELSFEWKIAPRGNSGLKYRVRKYGRKMLGCEYQVLDDEKYGKGRIRTKGSAGALYDLYEPNEAKCLRPAGEFNSARIVVQGDHIKHWLNGQLIVSATVGDETWDQAIAESKFSDAKDFSRNRTGRIMLTDHGSEVWYRNIRFCADETDRQDDGWVDLLSATTTNLDEHWTTTGNWTLKNGVATLTPRPGEKGWSRWSAYLWSRRNYADFEIEFEYQLEKRGNSGFYFRVGDVNDPVQQGIEVQIYDSAGKTQRDKLSDHDAGGIIPGLKPHRPAAKPAGEWNKMHVTHRNDKIIVMLNDVNVNAHDLSGGGQLAQRPKTGPIGFQDHALPISLRNIRIREL